MEFGKSLFRLKPSLHWLILFLISKSLLPFLWSVQSWLQSEIFLSNSIDTSTLLSMTLCWVLVFSQLLLCHMLLLVKKKSKIQNSLLILSRSKTYLDQDQPMFKKSYLFFKIGLALKLHNCNYFSGYKCDSWGRTAHAEPIQSEGYYRMRQSTGMELCEGEK